MKILVNLRVPAISEQFDILVPDSLRIRKIATLLAKMVAELSEQMYVSSGQEVLCSVEQNILLKPNGTLRSYGIKNGDHLLLI